MILVIWLALKGIWKECTPMDYRDKRKVKSECLFGSLSVYSQSLIVSNTKIRNIL